MRIQESPTLRHNSSLNVVAGISQRGCGNFQSHKIDQPKNISRSPKDAAPVRGKSTARSEGLSKKPEKAPRFSWFTILMRSLINSILFLSEILLHVES